MVSLETFGGAEGARTFGEVVMGRGGGTRGFGFGAGMGWACRTAIMPTVAVLRSRS